jgi:hypothetical protein
MYKVITQFEEVQKKEKKMRVKAKRVSKKLDGVTWCRTSPGYDENAIEIDLNNHEEIYNIQGELPENDQTWPKGAPIADHAMVKDKILKKKSP